MNVEELRSHPTWSTDDPIVTELGYSINMESRQFHKEAKAANLNVDVHPMYYLYLDHYTNEARSRWRQGVDAFIEEYRGASITIPEDFWGKTAYTWCKEYCENA